MKLEKFLFCITLETAGLVLGFLGVFFCGFILLVLIGGYIILISVFSSSDFENGNKEDMMIVVYAVAIASIIPVIIGSIFLSASFYMNVLLIQGIRNNQYGKMLPWLIVNGIQAVSSVPSFIKLIIAPGTYDISPALYVLGFVIIAFNIYCILAVYSLYQNIREKSRSGRVINNAVGFLPNSNYIPPITNFK